MIKRLNRKKNFIQPKTQASHPPYRRRLSQITFNLALCFLILSTQAPANQLNKALSYHKDHRSHAKMLSDATDKNQRFYVMDEAQAAAYLHKNLRTLGLSDDEFQTLRFSKQKTSLSANHFYFQQTLNGIDILDAEIIVSANKNSGKVFRVYNNSFASPQIINPGSNTITEDEVLKQVWQKEIHYGKLISKPTSQLHYIREGSRFRLAHRVGIHTDTLNGHWEYIVDATDGKLIRKKKTDISRRSLAKYGKHGNIAKQKANAQKSIPFSEALGTYHSSRKGSASKEARAQKSSSVLATGQAQVFDPDPRTTLADETLSKSAPSSAFVDAYLTRDLLDIDFDGENFVLSGPWVTIEDWEKPVEPPSVSANGIWLEERGDNAFNDVMVYFHIDQNQRYLQELGYKDDQAIVNYSIRADTNGRDGQDNSAFIPPQTDDASTEGRLTFGHGCVPDTEDADIILHEYGHAIQSSIVPNFRGGDTGAIGEGFGDYWGGSYSYRFENGKQLRPEWFGTWSGHNSCWVGRVMNRHDARYAENRIYFAHQIVNGALSDELWSTPLFQSLITLTDMGVAHEDVDKIIIESHFGLGAGVTLPEIALSTVQAAENLFPNGPHASVFQDHFEHHLILKKPITTREIVLSGAGANGVPDPGETVGFTIPFSNTSRERLENVNLALSSGEENLTFPVSSENYALLDVDAAIDKPTPFRLSIPSDIACGEKVPLALTMTANKNDESIQETYDYSLQIGSPHVERVEASPNVLIPDNNASGTQSSLNFNSDTSIQAGELKIGINITHEYIGDLRVVLRSPAGTSVILWNQYGSTDEIIGKFPDDYISYESLAAFDGENMLGEWQLTVSDMHGIDTGRLVSWSIEHVTSNACEEPALNNEVSLHDVGILPLASSSSLGSNLAIDPGETFLLDIALVNDGSEALTNLSSTLSSDIAEVSIAQGASPFPNLSAYQITHNTVPFEVQLAESFACGETLSFSLETVYQNNTGPVTTHRHFELPVGSIDNVVTTVEPSSIIPDDDTSGLESVLLVSGADNIDSENFSLNLDIAHTFVGDLTIELTSPSGTKVTVIEASDNNAGQDLAVNFPEGLVPLDDFSVFHGEPATGAWILKITDSRDLDVGTLNSWGITTAGSISCAPLNLPPNIIIKETEISVTEGSSAQLDASGSTDPEGKTLSYVWAQTSGDPLTIANAETATPIITTKDVSKSTHYSFRLLVTDEGGASATESVTLTVRDRKKKDGGGSITPQQGLALLVICLLHFGYKRCLPFIKTGAIFKTHTKKKRRVL